MSTKTEGIAQCSVYCTFLSFVEREVQVIINVLVKGIQDKQGVHMPNELIGLCHHTVEGKAGLG